MNNLWRFSMTCITLYLQSLLCLANKQPTPHIVHWHQIVSRDVTSLCQKASTRIMSALLHNLVLQSIKIRVLIRFCWSAVGALAHCGRFLWPRAGRLTVLLQQATPPEPLCQHLHQTPPDSAEQGGILRRFLFRLINHRQTSAC